MSLSLALGLLLGLAAVLGIGLEVTREIGVGSGRASTWRAFVGGILAGTVLIALVTTLALFRDTIG